VKIDVSLAFSRRYVSINGFIVGAIEACVVRLTGLVVGVPGCPSDHANNCKFKNNSFI
jgi:hypothetical protein